MRSRALQGVRSGEDRDTLILVKIEQVATAGDDEVGLGGERAGQHVSRLRARAVVFQRFA
jgi:hypothetical protein